METLKWNTHVQSLPNKLSKVSFMMKSSKGILSRKLLDDLKERRGYSHLKEEALDCAMWRAHFGRGFGPVVRQTTK
jgi:hypothetical protein